MTMELQHEIDKKMAGPNGTFLERFAEQLGGKAGTTAAFTEPVERDGVTVIGVAKVRWGLGGGGGTGGSKEGGEGSGSGGGGGVVVTPTGFIEIKDGGAEYRPFRAHGIELATSLTLIGLGAAIALRLLLGGVRGLIKQ